LAGVDNNFRVIGSEDAEGLAMQNATIDELFEEGYEQKDQAFQTLLSVYWRKKSDNTLREILLSTYTNLRDRADYRQYLQNSGEFSTQTFENVAQDLFVMLKEKCAYYLKMLETEKAYFEEQGIKNQTALCTELCTFLKSVISAQDYFGACAIEKPKFTANRGTKKDSDETKKRIQKLAVLKDKVVKIYDDELSKTESKEKEEWYFMQSGKIASALKEYLLRFDEKYAERKKERGVLDYADLEHKALELLNLPEIAEETKQKYRYVFVDEYQDVNPVQEAILSRVWAENVFLVGDVKQSIYGFRGSKSKFFVDTQKLFEQGLGNSLVMKRNFRSSDKVLDAVNKQFSLAMTKETCEVDYENSSYMERGGAYPLADGDVKIHIIPEEKTEQLPPRGVYSVRKNAEKNEEQVSSLAKTIRDIIQSVLHTKFFDAETGEYRLIEYADIAVLSRKKQGQIAKTVSALSAEGIPVTSASAVNICDYAEVKTLIDILSLIDNAEQDVPLCSALLSAMGEMTADELTDVRLAYKEEKFFRNACKKYAQEKHDLTAHKLRKFYDYYAKLRAEACVLDAGELLTKSLRKRVWKHGFYLRIIPLPA
jgi:ATP-dependent helicase/nuclease subunit A